MFVGTLRPVPVFVRFIGVPNLGHLAGLRVCYPDIGLPFLIQYGVFRYQVVSQGGVCHVSRVQQGILEGSGLDQCAG